MKNDNFYSEKMKRKTTMMKGQKMSYELDVYIQMVLDEALFNRKLNLIKEKINTALDNRDQTLFYKYSMEYKQLIESY